MSDRIGMALDMIPLLERGTEELRATFAHLSEEDRPIGLSIDIVTEADFIANAKLVLHHVCENGLSCHVLCSNGTICSLLERLVGYR